MSVSHRVLERSLGVYRIQESSHLHTDMVIISREEQYHTIISPFVFKPDFSSSFIRIRCTMGRAMYSDSAIDSCRPRGVGLARRSSSCSLLFLARLGSPHSRLCNDDTEGRKQGVFCQFNGF